MELWGALVCILLYFFSNFWFIPKVLRVCVFLKYEVARDEVRFLAGDLDKMPRSTRTDLDFINAVKEVPENLIYWSILLDFISPLIS